MAPLSLPGIAGRVAVVTGAGSGIGRASAASLLRAGARVALVDANAASARDAAAALRSSQDAYRASCYGQEDPAEPCAGFEADVRSAADVARVVSAAAEALRGCPSVLVNSAGITRDGFLGALTEQSWDEVLDVNLKGTFLTTQAFARQLAAARAAGEAPRTASVINVSSIIGKVGNLGQANYAASKAGVIGFTKTAAKELARDGVRVNALLPGFIRTPMTDAVPQKVIDKMRLLIPAGELGEPEDIANAVLFLASDLSSYVTGAALEVTGGMHC
eukprot:TRINITY_DN40650_c0_g1_i2.p2 TRINITY_DN40650_c0_g1~~TRINITY_DN40650_c0_g1_i2.p2  ORF type:complete len:293 (+),score=95.62 TRINITY_DN40650_c0_g1_i2:55-879(+)